ncbi:hypothetical protein BGZ51_003606 [Haplosporangium sp. Z 767]|nr:hypothetical protein BGZ51_003606 [Haplosporangium sp. Z 767]KAF9195918.1 hypothetical protein BGZ50_002947 [Haplosporangium sp. Z 11]
MQENPIPLTNPILGAGAKAGAVDVAAAGTRMVGNGISLESQSEAFRRRSLCSIDQPGVVMSKLPQDLEDTQHEFGSKLVVIMVGLPARGKSYLVKKLQRYLTWLQYDTKVFNVGNRRRIASKGDNKNGTSHSHAFFDPNNTTAKTIRDELALESLEELINWLKQGGRVGIHDPVVLAHNISMKLSSPDYKGMDEAQARADFKKRLENYERAYQTLSEEDEEDGIQYCKLINVGKKVIAYNIQGYLAGQCIFYLMNFNLSPRCIWLTRHGESVDNMVGKIGGDAALSAKGRRYADCLSRFIKHQREENAKSRTTEAEANMAISPRREKTVAVWTSMLTRTKETVEQFDPKDYDIKHIRFLNEIYAGMGGESYLDVIQRLNPLIIEIERMTSDLLIVTHRVVLRILLGYLMDIDRSRMPDMDVHLHTLYCVEPKPHGTVVRKFRWVEEQDWFVEEPL